MSLTLPPHLRLVMQLLNLSVDELGHVLARAPTPADIARAASTCKVLKLAAQQARLARVAALQALGFPPPQLQPGE